MSYIEKFRPTSFDQVEGQTEIINSLKEIIKRAKLGEKPPNLLFYGPPGVGKTTVAIIFARELYGPNFRAYFHEFNASDARKIDDIRNKIKPISMSSIKQTIFFDESDGMTNESQNAMRRISEKSQNVTFILTANNETKLIEALRSRCVPFYFKPLTESQILKNLVGICQRAGIKLNFNNEEREAFMQIIKQSHGDMRKSINILEKIITSEKSLNVQSVLEIKNTDTISNSLTFALNGDFEKAKNLMEDAYLANSNIDSILDDIYIAVNNIENVPIKIRLLFELGNLEHKLKTTGRPIIQLVAFISYVAITPHLKVK